MSDYLFMAGSIQLAFLEIYFESQISFTIVKRGIVSS